MYARSLFQLEAEAARMNWDPNGKREPATGRNATPAGKCEIVFRRTFRACEYEDLAQRNIHANGPFGRAVGR